jgi:hypothetical protein
MLARDAMPAPGKLYTCYRCDLTAGYPIVGPDPVKPGRIRCGNTVACGRRRRHLTAERQRAAVERKRRMLGPYRPPQAQR